MKKLFIILGISLLVVNVAYAGTMKENCGCGIGTMVFEGNDGLLSQICAVTTNGTFGNQTFGITSGTLECSRPEKIASAKLNRFVADNMDNLAVEMASGNGESLATLAELMEVPVEKRTEFYALLQYNFSKIYSSTQVTHVDVINNISAVIEQS